MARLKLRTTLIAVSVIFTAALVACGGDSDDPTATPGPIGGTDSPIPTATPLALLPVPTILDTSGGGGGDDGEPAEDVRYVVVAGDTLSRIAQEFGTTVDALLTANDLSDANIFVGQELTIPGASGSLGAPATPTPQSTTGVQTYIVQAGDSGFGIALEFGITLEALAAANGLSVDDLANLQINQELQIPAP